MRRDDLMINSLERLKKGNRENTVTPSPESFSPVSNSSVQAMQNSHSFRLVDEPKDSIESDDEFILAPASNRSKNSYNNQLYNKSSLKSTGLAEQYFDLQPEVDPKIIRKEGAHFILKDEKKDDSLYAPLPNFNAKIQNHHQAKIEENLTSRRITAKREATQQNKWSRVPLVAVFKARIAELEKELEETKNAITDEQELSKTLAEELDSAINEMKNDAVQIEKDLRLSRAEVKYHKRKAHSTHADYKFRMDQMQQELSLAQDRAAAAVAEADTLKKELKETQMEHSKLTSNVLKDAANLINEVRGLNLPTRSSVKGHKVQRSFGWILLVLLPVSFYLFLIFQLPVHAQNDLLLFNDVSFEEISSRLHSFLVRSFLLKVESSSNEKLNNDSSFSTMSNVPIKDPYNIDSDLPGKIGEKLPTSDLKSSSIDRSIKDVSVTRNRHDSSRIVKDSEGSSRDFQIEKKHNEKDQKKDSSQTEEFVLGNEASEFKDEKYIRDFHYRHGQQHIPKISDTGILDDNHGEDKNLDENNELRVERVTIVQNKFLEEDLPNGINRKSRRNFVVNLLKEIKRKIKKDNTDELGGGKNTQGIHQLEKGDRKKWWNIVGIK